MTSWAEENLRESRQEYDTAQKLYWIARDRGDIVPLDRSIDAENEAFIAGQRFKCLTPEATKAMGRWQKAKAELDHWNASQVPRPPEGQRLGGEGGQEPAPRTPLRQL